VLVEGPAGVGKTELAKALAKYLGRELVRLQCYEGLDEAKALYEWNYRKQLLRIQAEASGTGWDAVQDDIFGEEFLLARPLMTAIASEEPVVLLIDEIDKTDQEFEAMLLELLSDFQISIPELGRIEARTHPVVLLTSNNSRELTEALKRRCLYLWLDYPELEHELEIVRLHAPGAAGDGRAQAGRGDRHGARARPEEAAEHRRVDRLGARAAAARRRGHRRARPSARR
jgi:MoxR-like ATPase